MAKKKSILIVAIIAVLVVAISGVSFATWQAFVKPADQTWTVTANNPEALKVSNLTPLGGEKYNGETGDPLSYQTRATVKVTSSISMTIKPSAVITAKLVGSNTFVAVPAGASAMVTKSIWNPGETEVITLTVFFPDLSDHKYFGAEFNVAVILDKQW